MTEQLSFLNGPAGSGQDRAVLRVADALGVTLEKKMGWSWNPFRETYRYTDNRQREFRVRHFPLRREYRIRVIPPGKRGWGSDERHETYWVRGTAVLRQMDRALVLEFLREFLERRKYRITSLHKHRDPRMPARWTRCTVQQGGHQGELEILSTRPAWEVVFRDSDPSLPFFCGYGRQYRFRIVPRFAVGSRTPLETLLREYREEERESAGIYPARILRNLLFGYGSMNLRAFYGPDGLVPEVRTAIVYVMLYNLSQAIVGASVFVRVAERLAGNAWYTLAAGILVFLRAPAELFFMRRAFVITDPLPSSSIRKWFESEPFQRIYEGQGIRAWRNLERGLTAILTRRGNLQEALDRYCLLKPRFLEYAAAGQQDRVLAELQEVFSLSPEETRALDGSARNLLALDTAEIAAQVEKEVRELGARAVLKEGSLDMVVRYVEETFRENLSRSTCSKAFELLRNRIKQEQRSPSRRHMHDLLVQAKRMLVPFRVLDFLLLISLFSVGYAATFLPGVPDTFFPVYYIVYGALIQVIYAAIERFFTPINLQYFFPLLDSSPTVRSAADAWNEYNSILMRTWAVFYSLGTVLGVLGKVFSNATGGATRYGVEIFAFLCFIQFLRLWHRFLNRLIRRNASD